MTADTLALVESGTQLLNVAEWAHARRQTDGLRIDVLSPRDPYSVVQLARVREIVADLGIDVRTRAVRTPGFAAVRDTAGVLRRVAGASRLIIGDPFSRYIQTVLPASGAEEVVVVDDGTATWHFAACINAGEPLVRWDVRAPRPDRRADRAAHLLSPSLERQLSVFSCLNHATPVGATRLVNAYELTRSLGRPMVLDGEVDVIGASLVDTGMIERAHYVAAVAALARRHRRIRYIAHRRESDMLVAEIANLPGVRAVRLDLPVELALRQGLVAERVITFPSTAAHTLPLVLADAGVRIEAHHVGPGWFRNGTTAQARGFVDRITSDAPARPILEIA